MGERFHVDADIRKAETLPASFYRDKQVFERMREKIFLRTWQFIGDENLVKLPGSVYPFVLLDNFLTEPLVLTRDKENDLHCLSNVCTHRANLVCLGAGKAHVL